MFLVRVLRRHISPTENISVAILALGEGWHNYHHVFPWDYKAAELGQYGRNWTTGFLDLCARLGLAYDLKVASEELVRKRVLRSGDGTHHIVHEHSHGDEVTFNEATPNYWTYCLAN